MDAGFTDHVMAAVVAFPPSTWPRFARLMANGAPRRPAARHAGAGRPSIEPPRANGRCSPRGYLERAP